MAIFVSYSRKDTESNEFQLLLRDLELMRRQIWIDQRLTGGQPWWDEILHQIRNCDLFIMVVTRRSLKSEACRRELTYAAALKRPVLPLRLTDLSDWQLPELLSRAQITDYTKRAASGDAGVTCAFGLRDAVENLTAGGTPPALPDPLPTPPDVPPSYTAKLQPLLEAKELPLARQMEFVQEVKANLDDEDEDRKSILEALQVFRARPDIAYSVALELDRLVRTLTGESAPISGDQDSPEADRPNASETEVLPGSGVPSSGSKVQDVPNRSEQTPHEQDKEKSKIENFRAPGLDIAGLGGSLKSWYEWQKLEARTDESDGIVVIQCRSRTWARRLGAGAALTVCLSTDGDELTVEIGGAQWGDKVAAAGVGMFVMWPAAITAALGAHKQATLPGKTFEFIRSMVPRYSRPIYGSSI